MDAAEVISIHALREEGDVYNALLRLINIISIHALREEGDQITAAATGTMILFLSTPSARRATGAIYLWYTLPQYFYPRPPRGGRLCSALLMDAAEVISIHALREEGDLNSRTKSVRLARFLSTPSARRATSTSVGCVTFWFLFLSTPSARRATRATRRRCP